jgi:hypothetical protein
VNGRVRRRLSSLSALAIVVLLVSACGGGSSTTGSSTTSTDPGLAASQNPRAGQPQQSKPLPGHPKIGPNPAPGPSGTRHPGSGSSRRSEPPHQRAASKPAPAHVPSPGRGSPELAEKRREGGTRTSNRAAERREKRHPQAAVRELRQAAGKAAPFLVPVGDNSIPTYGTEASASQLAGAEAAISAYLGARAEGDWATACSLMSASVQRQIAVLSGEPGGGRSSCATAYSQLSERAPAAERADPLTQGLTALRVESPHAFALFYGPGSRQYMMPLEEEGGAWKVTQIAPLPWPLGSSSGP